MEDCEPRRVDRCAARGPRGLPSREDVDRVVRRDAERQRQRRQRRDVELSATEGQPCRRRGERKDVRQDAHEPEPHGAERRADGDEDQRAGEGEAAREVARELAHRTQVSDVEARDRGRDTRRQTRRERLLERGETRDERRAAYVRHTGVQERLPTREVDDRGRPLRRQQSEHRGVEGREPRARQREGVHDRVEPEARLDERLGRQSLTRDARRRDDHVEPCVLVPAQAHLHGERTAELDVDAAQHLDRLAAVGEVRRGAAIGLEACSRERERDEQRDADGRECARRAQDELEPVPDCPCGPIASGRAGRRAHTPAISLSKLTVARIERRGPHMGEGPSEARPAEQRQRREHTHERHCRAERTRPTEVAHHGIPRHRERREAHRRRQRSEKTRPRELCDGARERGTSLRGGRAPASMDPLRPSCFARCCDDHVQRVRESDRQHEQRQHDDGEAVAAESEESRDAEGHDRAEERRQTREERRADPPERGRRDDEAEESAEPLQPPPLGRERLPLGLDDLPEASQARAQGRTVRQRVPCRGG
jgi:hypothetical protein